MAGVKYFALRIMTPHAQCVAMRVVEGCTENARHLGADCGTIFGIQSTTCAIAGGLSSVPEKISQKGV